MNYNNFDIDPAINYTHYKHDITSNSDLFPNTAKNKYPGMEFVHEHFFKVYDPFQLDHSCSKGLLIKCVSCSDIFCNACGKRIQS